MGFNNLTKIAVALVLLAALAGCTGLAEENPNSPESPISVSVSPTPDNVEAFPVVVEDETFICIKYERKMGAMTYSGLSCNPVNQSSSQDDF